MRDASHFHLYLAVADLCHHRYMLFVACVNSIRNEFLHLFAAAYNWNFGVNHLVDDIAAMAAFIKLCSHNIEF